MNKLFVLFICLLIGGCATPKVVSHQTPNTDLTQYKTFGLVSGQNFAEDDIRTKDLMEEAIIREMEIRGYSFSLEYDLKVSYQIILSTETQTNSNYQSYPYYGRSYLYQTVDVRYYQSGILLIEMRDINTKRIIWQGSVDMKLNKSSKQKLDLADFTRLIFTAFPIAAMSNEQQEN